MPITDIADRTALDLQQLADLDRFPVSSTAPDDTARWRRLTTPADISWQSSPTG